MTPKPNPLEQKILLFLEKTIPEKRMTHILGVMELAEKLARKHRLDPAQARLAASLHDLARCWSPAKLIRYAKKHRLKIPHLAFACKVQPVLLHSFVSAELARRLFGVRQRQVLSAISKHSSASMRMTPFEKLIYLADLLAPDRTFPGADKLRALALKNMDEAFLKALQVKMVYLLQEHQPIHPDAVQVWNHFLN